MTKDSIDLFLKKLKICFEKLKLKSCTQKQSILKIVFCTIVQIQFVILRGVLRLTQQKLLFVAQVFSLCTFLLYLGYP